MMKKLGLNLLTAGIAFFLLTITSFGENQVPSTLEVCSPELWNLKSPETEAFLGKLDERVNLLSQLLNGSNGYGPRWKFVLDRQGKLLSSEVQGTQSEVLTRLIAQHKSSLSFPALPASYHEPAACFQKNYGRVYSRYKENTATRKYGFFSVESLSDVLNGKQEPKLVIPFQFAEARSFHEGLAAVAKQTNSNPRTLGWYFIDVQGKSITGGELYDGLQDFSGGYARVMKDSKWGLIDKSGKKVIPIAYERIRSVTEGIAEVQISGKTGFINTSGEVILEPTELQSTTDFSEGVAILQDQAGNVSLLDKDGKRILLPFKAKVHSFSEGLASFGVRECQPCGMEDANIKYGFLDKFGKIVVPAQFEQVRNFREGLAAVALRSEDKQGQKRLKWGLIDKNGNYVLKPEYERISEFKGGFAVITQIMDRHGKAISEQGLINKSGNIIVSPMYTRIEHFSEGLAVVTKTDYASNGLPLMVCKGYIDTKGQVIIPFQFKYASSFENAQARVAFLVPPDEKAAGNLLIDKTGKVLGSTNDNDYEAQTRKRAAELLAKESPLIPLDEETYKYYQAMAKRVPVHTNGKRQFHTSIITGQKEAALPEAMIPDEMKVHTPLHVVTVMGPKKDNKDIIVRLSVKDKPVSLFLAAYHSTNWIIKLEAGVKLAQVIVGGYEPQTLSPLPQGVNVFNYSMRTSSSASVNTRIRSQAEYNNLIEKVQFLTGVKPQTVQSDYYPTAFEVNGTNNLNFPSINTKYDQSKVILHCSWCTLGPDAVSVSKGTAFSTRAYHNGKYYFETKLVLPQGQTGAYHVTNVGITSGPAMMMLYNYHSGDEGEYSYGTMGPIVVNHERLEAPLIDRSVLKNGDVIGFALDLDQHRYYFSLNGKWLNGNPTNSNEGGMPIKANLEYQAAFSTDRNSTDILLVNFGTKPFQYPVPKGYEAYCRSK